MPALPNKKQELFCRFMADPHVTQSSAYELAGYTPSSSNASILANKPEIKERIKELRDEKQREEVEYKLKLKEAGIDPNSPPGEIVVREWSADRVREMLAQNAVLAQVVGDFKSSKESLELIGKSLGMFDKESKESGKSSGPQVSIGIIGQATSGSPSEGGRITVEGPVNPLRPRLPSPDDAERVG